MKISTLSSSALRQKIGVGMSINIGPFFVNISSSIPSVIYNIENLYPDYLVSLSDFSDFYLTLQKSAGLRRFYKPQVVFNFDGHIPFKPLPYSQSFAMFEWGLNWCIASYAHQYLIIHAAVVERDGLLVILPGSPGAGKSTLCAALVNSGWTLFSDEMALLNPRSLAVTPIPRPISLKNESIDLIRVRFPQVTFGLIAEDTHKGKITHIKPILNAKNCSNESIAPSWVVFPKFKKNSELSFDEVSPANAFMQLAEQGFNYHLLGKEGFDGLTRLVDSVNCASLEYSSLDEALSLFDGLSS